MRSVVGAVFEPEIFMTRDEILGLILKAGSESLAVFGGEFEGGWHIQQVPEELADALHYLSDRNYTNYLEVGAAAGGTARLFKEALGIENVYVIDNNSHPRTALRKQILPDAVEWIGNARSSQAILQLMQWNVKFDLVLLDAEHHYDGVFQYLWIIAPFLAKDAVVCVHDIFSDPGTLHFWREIQLGLWSPAKADRFFGTRLGIGIIRWDEPKRVPVPFHIITPTCRPALLETIDRVFSVYPMRLSPRWHVIAEPACREFDCLSHVHEVIFDGQPGSWGGAQRNVGLESVDSGWVYFLDDDNLLHPALEHVFLRSISLQPKKKAWAFRQVDKNGEVWVAANPPVGFRRVDTGSVVIDRKFIGEERWDYNYTADVTFYERLYRKSPESWGFIDIPCCFYNALR